MLIDILPDLPATLKDDPVKLMVNAEAPLLPIVSVLSILEFQLYPFHLKVVPPTIKVSFKAGLLGKLSAIMVFRYLFENSVVSYSRILHTCRI
tara:strand:- start:46 stop:324 length:279 start_codon:yes stop_codon:yes gene_type:complete